MLSISLTSIYIYIYIVSYRSEYTNLIQCAVYGLSTDRLTPHPFNLCSSAGSTHTSISQTQPLDMMRSTCTQLLWSTLARPVLSGTCPVKPLYGLGHRANSSVSGSWQSSYSLRHLYVEQQLFFSDPQSSLPWGAMLKFSLRGVLMFVAT